MFIEPRGSYFFGHARYGGKSYLVEGNTRSEVIAHMNAWLAGVRYAEAKKTGVAA